jgi:Glycosyl hydrolases family 8
MAIVYQNPCNSLVDFTSINGSGVTISAGTGYVGSSLKIGFVTTGYVKQSAFISLGQVVKIWQVYFMVPSATAFATTADGTFVAIYPDSQYEANLAILQVRIQGSGPGFTLKIVNPTDGYTGDYGNSTVFTKDVFHRLVIERTATQWKVYLDKSTTPILLYVPNIQPPTSFAFISLGCDYNNQAGAIVGDIHFDQIMARNPLTTTVTLDDQLQEVWEGIQMRYITTDGAVVRPFDVQGGQTSPDLVSEGIVYGLLHAVQRGDSVTFKRIDNWTRANLDRRVSTTANSVSNIPANAFNLMAFLYKPNAVKPITDANWAGDADIERGVALSWAHARFGSSTFTVDTPQELITPNYFARAKAVIDDLRNFAFGYSAVTDAYYLLNDSLQLGNSTVQLAPDYNYVSAYRDIFRSIDPTNSAFWDKCVKGAYDINDKSAAYTFSPQTSSVGFNPNWCKFDFTTATVTGTSTYGDSHWGYNSFRTNSRMLDDWNWYRDQRAVTQMQKPKVFLTNEWQSKSKIQAEYKHDGTTIIDGATPRDYSTRLFYFIYYFILTINDPTNIVGNAILNTQLNNSFQYSGNGSYFGSYGYFDDFWQARYEAQKAGKWINYGQPQLNQY